MMELGLSLGASKPFTFMEKPSELPADLNTTLSIGPITTTISKSREEEDEEDHHQEEAANKKENNTTTVKEDHEASTYKHSSASLSSSSKSNNNNSLQLHLLPHHSNPVPLSSFSWHPPSDNCDEVGGNSGRALKVKTKAEEEESEERTVVSSSPMSGASSFPVDLCIYSSNNTNNKGSSGNNYNSRKRLQNNNESEGEAGNYNYYDQRGCSSRASDEDDNNNNVGGVSGCGTRKKLRLSKEQSAFLEESFKEHSTLNPKQKVALAKQLNLRPRQVEVWFQNRRARTKLKQTEVDCEYLKRCCETLSEENRRLQKELQELRALKASNSNPFFMKLPATTLTMCRSCERVAPNNSSSNNNNNSASSSKPTISFPFAKPKFYPFPHSKPHQS